MRLSILCSGLLISTLSVAQGGGGPEVTPGALSWIPRPIIYAGPALQGGGYQMVAGDVGGGLLMRSGALLADVEGYYSNAKKVNDGTINNYKGHERFLQGRLFVPWRHGTYFGGGAQWSETSTTNYEKKGWRPTFGGGMDRISEKISWRFQALYVTKGTDRLNGVQGPEFQVWLPSPASAAHFFFRETVGVYEYHTTVTDPTDRALTASQTGQRSAAGFTDFALVWRF